MYLEFFRLRERPFNVTPDPHFLFMSPSHQESFATLLYGVRERKGFVMVTGEVGTGKTTLLHNLLDQLDESTQFVFVFHTGIDFLDLLEIMHQELGIPIAARSRASMLQSLNRHLIELLQEGRNCVLVIDEAQNLSPEILENLRLLSNLETAKDKLLQIVLVGQLELEEKINLPALRQLRQRITVQSRLAALSFEESRSYVLHRLEVAGAVGAALFSDDALNLVCHRAEGIPRQLNVFCDNALLIAYAEGDRQVNTSHVREVLRDRDVTEALSRRRRAVAESRPDSESRPRKRGRLTPRIFAAASILLAAALLFVVAPRLGLRRWFPDETRLNSQLLLSLLTADEAEGRAAAAPDLPVDAWAGPLSRESTTTSPGFSALFPPANADAADAAATPPDSFPLIPADQLAAATRFESSAPGQEITAAPPREAARTETEPRDEVRSDPPGAGSPQPRQEDESPPATDAAPPGRKLRAVQWIEFPSREREPATAAAATPAEDGSPTSLPMTQLSSLSDEEELRALLDRSARKAYTVRLGDSFGGIVQAVTGRSDSLILRELRRMNPHIRDFDHIEPGWIVYLPDLEDGQP